MFFCEIVRVGVRLAENCHRKGKVSSMVRVVDCLDNVVGEPSSGNQSRHQISLRTFHDP